MIHPNQGLGTLGHPGIFLGQTKSLGFKNHVDIPYVTSLAPADSLDFGVLDLWALKQRSSSPLLTMAIDNAQVIYSNADHYTYELPIAGDTTNRLVSGGNGKAEQGKDGEEIPLIVTKRDLSGGSILKFDLSSRISFTVVDRPIDELGEHFKVWVTLNTNPYVPYVSQAEFQPQRQIIKLADTRGLDFSSFKSVWQFSGIPSMAKYKNYLSNAILQQSYRVSSGAVHYLNSSTRIDPRLVKEYENTLIQFYSIRGIADNKVVDLTNADNRNMYMDKVRESVKNNNGEALVVNMLDNICIDMMLKQNNDLMVWSDGINMLRDGYDTRRLIPGIWFQLDMAGYKHTFDLNTFELATITDAIKDFEFGKVELRESVSNNVYTVKTGRGGIEMIQKAFLKEGFSIPAQLQNSEFGFITGPNSANLVSNLPRFVKYQIEGIGYLQVEWEPGFDPVMADEFVNPIVQGGYRLSSYTMLIEDYDTSRDNLIIVRGNNSRIRMNVQAGDETHPYFKNNINLAGQNVQIHQASDELSGYQVKFSGKADSAIVKDPTKLLKLSPINPRTGLASL